MNTLQINEIIEKDSYAKKYYLGTVALDQLPQFIKYPSCFILNNQKSNQPGQHWIAIYFGKNQKAEFFDSFGQSAKYYNLENYIKTRSKGFVNSNIKLQSNYSTFCGYYCVLYILLKSRGWTLSKILKQFKSPRLNDKLIKRLINKF